MRAQLERRLGTGDAVVIGLASMLGAGVFVVLGPASAAAGGMVLVSVVVAGLVAWANATSTAQLAAAMPTSGGNYAYGRARLGPWPGFVAGWGFVAGKTASCAAMATTVATYLVPDPWRRPLAALVVVALVAVNLLGVQRTARVARVLLACVLVDHLALVVAGLVRGDPALAAPAGPAPGGVRGVIQGAALVFFAFAGYARVATLGEEVRSPRTTIPRAILVALAVVAVVYLAVGLAVLASLGPAGAAGSSAPLADAAGVTAPWLVPAVRVAAVVAAAGSLLVLRAGVSRTTFAMARDGELPAPLARVGERHAVPWVAEVAVGVLVVVLTLTVDLAGVIAFSSLGVLVYYGIRHAAAWTQTGADRSSPRWVQAFGLVACAALILSLPARAIGIGVGVLVVGLVGRMLGRRLVRRRA
jgi:APA family basic amino acid/polyamine antiporter